MRQKTRVPGPVFFITCKKEGIQMKNTTALLLVGSILAMATVAFAGNKADTFSVSPVIGGITFGGDQRLETSPVFGARAGYNFTKALGIEALFDWSRTEGTRSNGTVDLYRYGGELLYHFWPDDKFVPYVAAGYAGINFKGNTPFPETAKTKGAADYGVGFKYFVTEDMAWRADVRHLIYVYSRDDQHAVEYTTGVYIPFGGTPAVSKLADPPPPPPPVAKKVAAAPPPAPLATLSASPDSITKGQNSTLSWTSQNATNCEILPGVGPVQMQGTTTVTPDNNTIYSLTCKGEGGAAKSEATVYVTEPIAPPPPPPPPKPSAAAERFCNKPAILMVYFDVDKYNIKPQYHAELKTVGDFLKEFPTSHGVIEGHTDGTASRAYNQKLSERRANSVKEYLIKTFGIAPERLASKGYGKDKPVATNKTAAGRAKNRRMIANFVCE
jgi:OOP family OmpA-OmpF porin